MFGWRKRSEGFEWREYVRTTVLVRRADRQRRIEDMRMDAVAKITDARDRSLEAGKNGLALMWERIAEFLRSLVDIAVAVMSALALAAWSAMKSTASAIGAGLARLPLPELPKVSRQSADRREPREAGGARRLLPADWARYLPGLPRFPDLPELGIFRLRNLGAAALCIAAALGLGPMLQGSQDLSVAQLTPHVSAPTTTSSASASASTLAGRASAVTGALLRVNGELIELKGIEAPDAKHPCLKANGRRWSCSASAASALNRLVRSEDVTCDVSSRTEAGRAIGTCRLHGGSRDIDVAAELVRGGHVFAARGFFAAYASEESQAQTEKAGLWQGETVRPQEWRDRAWQEAKRTAPDGCPIKGFVRGSGRIYAMPWSAEYNSGRVREVRGERWFCSEDDARAAGFRLSSRL